MSTHKTTSDELFAWIALSKSPCLQQAHPDHRVVILIL
jgi:hypothetical protein